MLQSLIIVFRELLEIGLVVGIILASTRGVPRRGHWISYGVAGGVAGSCLVALCADTISNALAGVGQEVFNASLMLIAVLMLGWHNVWMARHGRLLAAEMKAVGAAVADGQRALVALTVVVGVAILREGSEIVLFLYGVAASGADSTLSMMTGGAIGLLLGMGTATLLYLGLLRVPARYFFSVTSVLIALLAAGMAAQAVAFLQQAAIITVLTDTVWDTSHILPEGEIIGKILHALVGYVQRPSGMQVMAYIVTLAAIFGLMRLFEPPARRVEPSLKSIP